MPPKDPAPERPSRGTVSAAFGCGRGLDLRTQETNYANGGRDAGQATWPSLAAGDSIQACEERGGGSGGMQSCEKAVASKFFSRSQASRQKLHVTARGGGSTAPEVVQSVLKPRHASEAMPG